MFIYRKVVSLLWIKLFGIKVVTSLHMTEHMNEKEKEKSKRWKRRRTRRMVGKHEHIHIIIGGYKGEVRGCSSCNHHQSLSNIVYTSITTCVISKRILSLVNHFIFDVIPFSLCCYVIWNINIKIVFYYLQKMLDEI